MIIAADGYSVLQRNAIIALKCFLGENQSEIAAEYGLTRSAISNAKKVFAEQRAEMLRFYFANREDKDAVADRFGVEPKAPTKLISPDELTELQDRLAAVEARLEETERDVKAIVQAAKPPPNPNGLNIPSLVDKPDAFDRRAYRGHVTGLATEQWCNLFGTEGHDCEPNDKDIRRRIMSLYFNGKMEGSGAVFTVTGVERYSMNGVRLSCTMQNNVVYISKVEKVEISDM